MKRIAFTLSFALVAVVVMLVVPGCLRQHGPVLRWSDFLQALVDTESIARLDTPQTEIITSFDPTGGNDDYNHFVRKGPKGWVVLCDLEGPGVLTRFWFTGADDGSQKFKFLIDGFFGEKLEYTLDELTGGAEPFLAPLAGYESYCWYSLIPIPYRKRLVIMTEEGGYREGGWPRLFYQINYTPLPRGQKIESFNGQVTEQDRQVLTEVRKAWSKPPRVPETPNTKLAVGLLSLQPGEAKWTTPLTGPGIIREIKMTPKFDKLPSAIDRQSVLRDVVLRIRWDRSGKDSVLVPFGDFFGSMWQRTRYQSMFFGLTNNTFSARFPMPFETQADIYLENQGIMPIEIETEVKWEPLPSWDDNWGYFHATWSGSTPQEVGRPHSILRAKGRGKYVGCLLGVVTLDRSWWILEGDEKMYIDGQSMPFWRGTGLEDYFNGGWYYQNPLARQLHGMVFKAFFRIVQYRLQLVDAVNFNTAFNMMFERGPDNASRGWMESVAYYYMDKPSPAAFALKPVGQRQPPRDPLAEATVMTELLNYERLGDYRGARDYIDLYLETFAGTPFAAILRLRHIAYTEVIDGFDAAWPLYQQFISTETDEAALAQAKLLAWLHEDKDNAILTLYSNAKSRSLLDGQVVCETAKPEKTAYKGIKVKKGKHCLATQSAWQSYPSWVQACLKTHSAMFSTEPDWRYAFNPTGSWASPGYNDSGWEVIGGLGTKGPPEEPYIWLEPNAFVGMQSRAAGLRPMDEAWPSRQSSVVFRDEFEVK